MVSNIANPSMKRTMALGPKKTVGKRPNPQIHVHTNKRVTYTDFDTFRYEKENSVKAGSQTTQAYSRMKTTKSHMSGTGPSRIQREGSETRNADMRQHVDTSSKCAGNLLSE